MTTKIKVSHNITITIGEDTYELSKEEARSLFEQLKEALGDSALSTPIGLSLLSKIIEENKNNSTPVSPWPKQYPIPPKLPPVWYGLNQDPDGGKAVLN